MKDEKTRRNIYNALISENYDLPSFEEFSEKVKNDDTRRNVYNALISENYDLPDFETFSMKILDEPKENAVQSSASVANVQDSTSKVGGTSKAPKNVGGNGKNKSAVHDDLHDDRGILYTPFLNPTPKDTQVPFATTTNTQQKPKVETKKPKVETKKEKKQPAGKRTITSPLEYGRVNGSVRGEGATSAFQLMVEKTLNNEEILAAQAEARKKFTDPKEQEKWLYDYFKSRAIVAQEKRDARRLKKEAKSDAFVNLRAQQVEDAQDTTPTFDRQLWELGRNAKKDSFNPQYPLGGVIIENPHKEEEDKVRRDYHKWLSKFIKDKYTYEEFISELGEDENSAIEYLESVRESLVKNGVLSDKEYKAKWGKVSELALRMGVGNEYDKAVIDGRWFNRSPEYQLLGKDIQYKLEKDIKLTEAEQAYAYNLYREYRKREKEKRLNREEGSAEKENIERSTEGYQKKIKELKKQAKSDYNEAVNRYLGSQSVDALTTIGVNDEVPFSAMWRQRTAYDKYLDAEGREAKLRYDCARHASTIMNDVKKTIKEAKSNHNFGQGVVSGLIDGLVDLRTWDFGITNAEEMSDYLTVLNKADRGEELSEAEDMFLTAMATRTAADIYFGSDIGRGYKAGKVTAESLPFMLEMMINPLSGIGEGIGAMFTRYAMKKFARKAMNKGFKRALIVTAKGTGRVLGDVGGATGMAATTSLARVMGDAEERMAGSAKMAFDKDGNVIWNGQEDRENDVSALAKGFLSTAISNFSEMVGAYNEFGAGVLKSLAEKGGSKALNALSPRLIGELKNVRRSEWVKVINGFEKRAQYHGVFGEFVEEIEDGIMNAVIVGDQTLDTNEDTGLFNKDNLIDTLLGVSIMGVVSSTVKGIGYAHQYHKGRKLLHEAQQLGEQAFLGQQERFDNIVDMFKKASDDELTSILSDILDNQELTKEQREAVTKMAVAEAKMRAVSELENYEFNEEDDARREKRKQINKIYDEAYNTESVDDLVKTETEFNEALNKCLAKDKDFNYLEIIDLIKNGRIDEIDLTNDPEKAEFVKALIRLSAAQKKENNERDDVFNGVKEEVKKITNVKTGKIEGVHLSAETNEDTHLYIVDGKIERRSDGTIDKEKSDEMIIVYDSKTGEKKTINISEIASLDEAKDADKEREERAKPKLEELEKKWGEARDRRDYPLLVEVGKKFKILDKEGEYLEVEVVEAVGKDNDGNDTYRVRHTSADGTSEDFVLSDKELQRLYANARKRGKKEKIYSAGEKIKILTDTGNVRIVTVESADDYGNVNVRFTDGSTLTLPASRVKEMNERFKEYRKTNYQRGERKWIDYNGKEEEVTVVRAGTKEVAIRLSDGTEITMEREAFDNAIKENEKKNAVDLTDENAEYEAEDESGNTFTISEIRRDADEQDGENRKRRYSVTVTKEDGSKEQRVYDEAEIQEMVVRARHSKMKEAQEKKTEEQKLIEEREQLRQGLANGVVAEDYEDRMDEINKRLAELNPVPTLADGNVDYGAITPERAEYHLYNEAGLEEGDADEVVKANKAVAEKELAKLQKGRPKAGVDVAKFKQELDEWQKKINEAEARVEYWNNVEKAHQSFKDEARQIFAVREAARQQADDKAFETALQTNTHEGYQQYLRSHPQGKHAEEAKKKILELYKAQDEKNEYQAAVVKNTKEAYEQYLSKYPQGKYVENAKKKIAELEKTEPQSDVPNWTEDKEEDAQKRGYRMSDGQRYDRQEPVEGVDGNEVDVDFSTSEKPKKARFKVVEASKVQPSHRNGLRNILHFISGAQPKDRSDNVSKVESTRIASNMKPDRITSGTNAYGGAPIVNRRGEVIQGNNRAEALRKMYENGYTESQKAYKQYLIDHASEFGLDAEEIAKMKNPVLVRELDVDDREAIRLGQFTSTDLETGGVVRIDAKTTAAKLKPEELVRSYGILFESGEEALTIGELIERNADNYLKYLFQVGAITETQLKSAYKSDGKTLTDEARGDIKKIMTHHIVQGGSNGLEAAYDKLPAAAQKALPTSMAGDMRLSEADRLLPDVQKAIMAAVEVMNSEMLKTAKERKGAKVMKLPDYEDVIRGLSKQLSLTGKPLGERYTPLELAIAAHLLADKQKTLNEIFSEYQRLILGQPGTMFQETEKLSREEAVERVFGIKSNPKEENNDPRTETNDVPPSGEERGGKKPPRGGKQGTGEHGGGEHGGGKGGEREVTREEIENSDLPETIKIAALGWLDGDKNDANQFSYLIAKDYVRASTAVSKRDSGNADEPHVGGETTVVSGLDDDGHGGRQGGGLDRKNNSGGKSTKRVRGEDSTDDVGDSNGEGGHRDVLGGKSTDSTNSTTGRVDGSVHSGKGDNDTTRKRGRRNSSSVSERHEGGQKSSAKSDEIHAAVTLEQAQKELDEAVQEFFAILDEDITDPIKGKLLAVDPISLYTALGVVKATRLVVAGSKVAYKVIELGFHNFAKWFEKVKSIIGDRLSKQGLSDEKIDKFIKMLWDQPFKINGETHKVSEWASIISHKELRKAVRLTIEEKRKLQAEAEGTPTVVGDLDNIRESLPFLLPAQHEDVQKAEQQFFDKSHSDAEHGNGKGYLFTNGTGTGKTYTGLGIVKRFVKEGKGRVLIVTAQDKKIKDWIKDAANMGITATQLKDTKDKGSGVVVTQYANMRQNKALLEDEFDLIIYDESHKLMENQNGTTTAASMAHHMIANRDIRQAARRKLMGGELGEEIIANQNELDLLLQALNTPTTQWEEEIKKAVKKAGGKEKVEARINELVEFKNRLDERIDKEIDNLLEDSAEREKLQKAVDKTKVVFLSATPFNNAMNIDYSEGYIFSYEGHDAKDPSYKESQRSSQRDEFLMKTFPSSFKRNPANGRVARIEQERISDPIAAGEEEISFSDRMQDELQTMSGRELDSEYDYSRTFPKMDFPQAELFNQAMIDISAGGVFSDLGKYFKPLTEDYTTMTAYLETIKAQMIAPRIKQYIEQGKKVTLFHRRKNSAAELNPPFADAIRRALADPEMRGNKGFEDAVHAFVEKYSELFEWEQTLRFRFPQDVLIEEFMTEEEKMKLAKDREKWEAEHNDEATALLKNINSLRDKMFSSQDDKETKAIEKLLDKEQKKLDKLLNTYPKAKSALVGVFNGSESEGKRAAAVDDFNNDNGSTKILVVQVQSGKEGISLHDTTGKYPRVQIGLFLPQSSIEFIQTEGRIFRVGNQSNAIFEYPFLGLDIELASFANKINGRSATTENLALGSRGRGLRDSIARSALASRFIDPKEQTGVGGKEQDRRVSKEQISLEEAMQNYAEWKEDGQSEDINNRQIPDPIGLLMSQWGNVGNGEVVFVPRAANGTVARYVHGKARMVALEERPDKYARLTALVGGAGRTIKNQPFDRAFSRGNKADVILINTRHTDSAEGEISAKKPDDVRDISNAMMSLENSGRIIAVVRSSVMKGVGGVHDTVQAASTGSRFYKVTTEIQLPANELGEAMSIVVIDRMDDEKLRNKLPKFNTIDLTGYTDENVLFQKMAGLTMPPRIIDETSKTAKRIKHLEAQFKKSGLVSKHKSGDKMEPYVYLANGLLNIELSGAKTIRGGRYIYIEFKPDRIDKNREDLAKTWKELDEALKLDDREFYLKYSYECNYKESKVASVRELWKLHQQSIEGVLNKTPMQIRNLAEGKAENQLSGSYGLDEFKECFDSMNNNNEELKPLAEKVFQAMGKIKGLQFRVATADKFRSRNTVAHYSPSKNAIELNESLINSIRLKDETKAQAILHESIHAISCWAIDTYDRNPELLTKEQREAVETIKEVYRNVNTEEFRAYLRQHSDIEDNAEYGLFNEKEMMAELSNPIFRAALKAKNLWRQLINGIKRLLGGEIPGIESEKTDALSELERALDTLMDNFDENLYSTYTKRRDVEEANYEYKEQRIDGDAQSADAVSEAEAALRDGLVETMREAGIEVSTDWKEGQAVLDAVNGVADAMSRGKMSERRQERDKTNYTIDSATAFVTGKTLSEARRERVEREEKRRKAAKEVYEIILSGEYNDVTLQKISNYIDDVTPRNKYGRRLSERLPQRVERALYERERSCAIDALYSRASESAVAANERVGASGRRAVAEKKKELIEKWAKASGNWHTDLKDFTDNTEAVSEDTADSDVYLSNDGKHVIKLSRGKHDKRFGTDIDAVTLFNYVFPNSAYKLLGYGDMGKGFVTVLEQPYVDFKSSVPLTEAERVEYMERLGFKPLNKENTAFSNGEIVVADLQGNNIVRDINGNIRVIDADCKLHTKDVGGEYSYPPVESDLPRSGVKEQRVYHGSGADFDTFDHSHMGEGEGAQAFGWGSYVTEVEGIGRTYAKNARNSQTGILALRRLDEANRQLNEAKAEVSNLSSRVRNGNEELTESRLYMESLETSIKETEERRKELVQEYGEESAEVSNFYIIDGEILERYRADLKHTANKIEELKLSIEESKADLEEAKERVRDAEERVRDAEQNFAQIENEVNRILYTVEIPDDNGKNYLEWSEKKIGEELATRIRNKLYERLIETDEDGSYVGNERELRDELRMSINGGMMGSEVYGTLKVYLTEPRETSMFLHSLGFTGIKYAAEFTNAGRKDGKKNYVIFDEKDLQIKDKEKFFRTSSGEAYGFVKGDKMYIDPRIATSETPIHEYSHMWAEGLRRANPEAWERLKNTLEGDKELVDYVKRMYPELEGDELWEEVFTHYSGRRGAERLRAEQAAEMEKAQGVFEKARVTRIFDRIRRALSEFWDKSRQIFAGKVEGLDKMSAEDFADMAMGDMLRGFNPKTRMEKQRKDGSSHMEMDEPIRFDLSRNAREQIEKGEDKENAIQDLTKIRLRRLKDGEISHVERRYSEDGHFSFTGSRHIESIDDVAFIFKQLETAAVENSFIVLVKNGEPTVIHVGMGNIASTFVDLGSVDVAINRVKPDKIYFVHNHPSGNLKSSRQDVNSLNHLIDMYGDRVEPGIIIDTTSGQYGVFSASDESSRPMSKATGGEREVKVYAFDKQVFAPDWDPQTAFQMRRSEDVAKFISSHRLGEHKKMGMLVLTNDQRVAGNIFLPWTSMGAAAKNVEKIAGYAQQMGGRYIILYGSYSHKGAAQRDLRDLKEKLSLRTVTLFDSIGENNHSANDYGLLYEPDTLFRDVDDEDGVEHFGDERVIEKARQRAQKLAESLGTKVRFVESREELPKGWTEKQKRSRKGWYDKRTGEVVIVLPNVGSEADVEKTMFHEVVGHKGLRKLFGKDFDTFLDNVYENASEEIRQKIDSETEKNGGDKRKATEEYLARLAEDEEAMNEAKRSGVWDKVKGWLIDLLSKAGIRLPKELNDDDLRYVLWKSRKNMEKGTAMDVAEDMMMRRKLDIDQKDMGKDYEEETKDIMDDYEDEDDLLFRDDDEESATSQTGGVFISPSLRKALDEIGERLENDRKKREEVKADYLRKYGDDFGPRDNAIVADYYERLVNSSAYQFREAVQDSMRGVHAVYEAILGKGMRIEDVPEAENAYIGENTMHGKMEGEQHEYFLRYFKPLLCAIHSIAGTKSKPRQELIDYMMAKHGLERNEVFAARDAREAEKKGMDYAEEYEKNRKKDYSGLTALTGKEDVREAEAEARRMVEEYESSHDTEKITELWRCTKESTQETLRRLHESGMLSDESFDDISSQFDFYIPLQGWDETTSGDVYGYLTSKDGPLQGSPIKHARGRRSKADDPIATIAMMADAGIRQANRNEMKQKFLTFVENHPSDLVSVSKLWLQYNEATDEWVPVFPNIKEDDSPQEVARKVYAFELRMEALAEEHPEMYKRGKEAANVPYKVVKDNLNEHQVLVKRGGETYVMTINGSPRAAQALNGLTNPRAGEGLNGFAKKTVEMVDKVMRFIAHSYIGRTGFMITNFFRDGIYANTVVHIKEGGNYARRFNKIYGQLLLPGRMSRLVWKFEKGKLNMNKKLDRAFYEFVMNGGKTGYATMQSMEQQKRAIIKELKRQDNKFYAFMPHLGKMFDMANDAVEARARFAAFLTSQQMGRSVGRSAYDAKEISVNFNKKGAGGKFLGAKGQTFIGNIGAAIGGFGSFSHVFWNAGVQGFTNYGRLGKHHAGKFSVLLASQFSIGLMWPLLMAALSDDDDEYYNLPSYVRRQNICIPLGNGKFFKVPLPIEFRAVYGLGEMATSIMSGKEFYSNKELAHEIMSQLTQLMPLDVMEGAGGLHSFIPSYATPVYEVHENKTWTGAPIYRDDESLKYAPEWQKAYPYTNKGLVAATKWLNDVTRKDGEEIGAINLNPAAIEHILKGYFGGYVEVPMSVINMTESLLGEKEFEMRNDMFGKRLFHDGGTKAAEKKIKSEYYKYREEYKKTAYHLQEMTKRGDNTAMGKADKIAFENYSPEYRRYLIMYETDKQVKKLQKLLKKTGDASIKENILRVMESGVEECHKTYPNYRGKEKKE